MTTTAATTDSSTEPTRLDSHRWSARLTDHVEQVEARLAAELDDLQSAWVRADDGDAAYAIDPPTLLRQLLNRGGKRTRPVMVLLGWAAGDRRGTGSGHADMVQAAVALEMLHCFALVHDDVMDESPTRRGQLTVHESAARLHVSNAGAGDSARFGDSIAILVGDLAHSEADRLACELPAPMRAIWRQMVLELVAGQLRDVVGSAAGERRVSYARLAARQKTGDYTVARPLQLGAAAAGASPTALDALARYGRHAGEAFALRDDILGVFGDPDITGKPAGEDIRAGKPTVLLALACESLRGGAARAVRAAGSPGMSDAQIRQVRDGMVAEGVLARVEALIDECVAAAVAALRDAHLAADAVMQLTAIVNDLAHRGR